MVLKGRTAGTLYNLHLIHIYLFVFDVFDPPHSEAITSEANRHS